MGYAQKFGRACAVAISLAVLYASSSGATTTRPQASSPNLDAILVTAKALGPSWTSQTTTTLTGENDPTCLLPAQQPHGATDAVRRNYFENGVSRLQEQIGRYNSSSVTA